MTMSIKTNENHTSSTHIDLRYVKSVNKWYLFIHHVPWQNHGWFVLARIVPSFCSTSSCRMIWFLFKIVEQYDTTHHEYRENKDVEIIMMISMSRYNVDFWAIVTTNYPSVLEMCHLIKWFHYSERAITQYIVISCNRKYRCD